MRETPKEHVDYIRDHFSFRSARDIADHLGITRSTVYRIAEQNGIRKFKERKTPPPKPDLTRNEGNIPPEPDIERIPIRYDHRTIILAPKGAKREDIINKYRNRRLELNGVSF